MADNDWDSVTRIGSKARGPGGGGVDRERVVKGKSAINAAQRSGAIIATERKYGGANSKAGTEGQHLTKVDREDGITKLKEVGMKVGQAISRRRQEMTPPLTQKDLANRVNCDHTMIQKLESGTAPPDNQLLGKIQRVLGVKLTGNTNIGEPLLGPKKK